VSPAQAIVTVPFGAAFFRVAAGATGSVAAAADGALSSASNTRVSPNAIGTAATATNASAAIRRRRDGAAPRSPPAGSGR